MNIGSTGSVAADSVQSAQGLAMLKKAMDVQKAEGQAAVKLIEAVPVPPPAPGTGTVVDVRA